MTLLCVPILVHDEHAARSDVLAASEAGADLVEFRVDDIFTGSTSSNGDFNPDELATIQRLIAGSPLPCIVTCRDASESGGVGGYAGDEMSRVSLIEHLGIPSAPLHPPRYFDVEYASYTRSANIKQKINLAVKHPRQVRDVAASLILSTHDFAARPSDLLRRVSAMQAEPAASIVKVAFAARSVRDNLELFDLLAESARPMIALGIGPFGLLSRVLAPKFKAFLTFASLRRDSATAPGQPTIGELLELYRFRSITPATRVFGLVGWPIDHTLSPLLHNAGFAGEPDHSVTPMPCVYLPLPVPTEYEHFKATLSALIDHPHLDFFGCSVTIPHKEHLVRLARERLAAGEPWSLDPLSDVCGSANTLVVSRDTHGLPSHCAVHNTDGPAACDSLATAASQLADTHVAILGAGGAARAVAAELLRRGSTVVIWNRTREKAERLVAELCFTVPEFAGRISTDSSIPPRAIVNCTPLGMSSGSEPAASPLTSEQLHRRASESRSGLIVMDTVYSPLRTPLLKLAEQVPQCHTLDGLAMFVRQAVMQFDLWHPGARDPAWLHGTFDRLARAALSGHTERS